MNKCKQCGAEMADDMQFCTSCGTKIEEAIETAAETVETAAQSVETAAQSVETAAQTVETVAETVETAAQSVETEAAKAEAVPRRPVVHSEPPRVEPPRVEPRYTAPKPRDPELITTAGWLGIHALTWLPGIGLLLLVIWALGGCSKRQKTTYARGTLLFALIGTVGLVVLCIIAAFVLFSVRGVWPVFYFENGMPIFFWR